MSVHYTSAVWFIQTKIPAEKLVLLCLADSANDEGTCWPSYATMARKCQMDRYWLMEIVGRLITRGLIEKHPRFAANGHPSSNSYRLLFPPHGMEGGSGSQTTKGSGGTATKVVVPRAPTLEPSLDPSVRSGGGTPKTSGALSVSQRISYERELEAVHHEVKVIQGNYGDCQVWCEDDKKKIVPLLARRKLLRQLLGRLR